MQFQVDEALFADLLREMTARGYSDDVTRQGGVVWLHTDLGPSFYLTQDGRVIGTELDREQPEPPPDRTAYAALVCGARNYSEPRLLELLPMRPPNVEACARCSGRRWWQLRDFDGRDFEIVCPDCSGLGWLTGCRT